MGPRGRRMRRRGMVVGMAAGHAMGKRSASDNSNNQSVPAVPTQSAMATQLQELDNLRQQGIITQEEFDAKKKQILGT